MKELFDKLILRMVFTIFILLILHLYKYAHSLLYPSARLQIFKKFYPSKNAPDTLHLFSRIIGIGVVFSGLHFNMANGIGFALFDFLSMSIILSILYLVSLYIIESIVLYNFEYKDEILKRKNSAYAIMALAHSLCVSYILKVIVEVSANSLVILLFLWLFSMVLVGFTSKAFPLISKLSFNGLLIQKNISIGLSYLGYILGATSIIASSQNQPMHEIKWYTISVVLKIVLALIIIPLFRLGLLWIFKFQDDFSAQAQKSEHNYGYGLYEGALFFTSCFLTTVITDKIFFGTFYPV